MSDEQSSTPLDAEAERKAKRKAYKRAYHQAWKKANPEKAAEGWNKWYQSNKPKKHAQSRAYQERNRDQINARKRAAAEATKLKGYGLTAERYADMLELCKGRCPLCKTPFSKLLGERPCIDHCHKTNAVRGILCKTCNLMLGHARDNPVLLRSAARYLTRANA